MIALLFVDQIAAISFFWISSEQTTTITKHLCLYLQHLIAFVCQNIGTCIKSGRQLNTVNIFTNSKTKLNWVLLIFAAKNRLIKDAQSSCSFDAVWRISLISFVDSSSTKKPIEFSSLKDFKKILNNYRAFRPWYLKS